jgi:hypothetical protein
MLLPVIGFKLRGAVISNSLLALVFAFLCGCATVGPGPTDKNYNDAIKTIKLFGATLYNTPGSWYPNTVLGDTSSFHNPSINGRLFFTPERFIFAVYDDQKNSFLKTYELSYSDIKWITGKQHGLSRILRIQSENTVNSFTFSSCFRANEQECSKDELMNFVLDKASK